MSDFVKHFPILSAVPDTVTLQTEQNILHLSGEEALTVDDVVINFLPDGTVTLYAEETAVCRLQLRWNVAMPESSRFLGDDWERGYGKFEWRGFVAERVMPWYFFANDGTNTAGYGVETRPDAMCCFCCDTKGITLILDVRCGGAGVILNGKSITCAKVVCQEYSGISAFDAACEFLKLIAVHKALPQKPVYGFNNWYYAYGNSSHEQILKNAEHLARLTSSNENRPYMIIDDGWQVKHSDDYNGGPWREGNKKFPDMKKLADEITAMDVLPGIWIRPLFNNSSDIPEDWFQNDIPGILDPSKPQVLEYISQDIKTIINWGYKLIKHDFSTFDLAFQWGKDMTDSVSARQRQGIAFSDRSKTTAMVIKELYSAIYSAAEGKALILGCNCIGHLGAGFMEINRTGDDTSGHQWERTRRMGVNTLAFRMPQHNALYAVDADCVGITEKLDWEKNKQWLALLSYSGTPLFVSVAPDLLNDENNAYLALMLSIASKPQSIARPLDWLFTTCPEHWKIGENDMDFDWYEKNGIENINI